MIRYNGHVFLTRVDRERLDAWVAFTEVPGGLSCLIASSLEAAMETIYENWDRSAILLTSDADVYNALTVLRYPEEVTLADYVSGLHGREVDYDRLVLSVTALEDAITTCVEAATPPTSAPPAHRDDFAYRNPLRDRLLGEHSKPKAVTPLGDEDDENRALEGEEDEEPTDRDPGIYDPPPEPSGWGVGTIAALAFGGLAIGLGIAAWSSAK